MQGMGKDRSEIIKESITDLFIGNDRSKTLDAIQCSSKRWTCHRDPEKIIR